ncbi:MAG: ATP-dependent DNA helicase RecG [Mycoplasmatales bacterium]
MELTDIKGIGEKTIGHLNKKGITTFTDLVTFYPINYDIYAANELVDKANVIISGMITKDIMEFRPRAKLLITTYFVNDGTMEYKIVAWNQRHLRFTLNEGNYVEVSGKYDKLKNQIVQTKVQIKAQQELSSAKFAKHRIIPIYSKVNKVSNLKIQQLILKAIKEITNKSYQQALQQIHNPQSYEKLNEAKQYLKYQEFLTYYQKLQKLKQTSNLHNKEYQKIINTNVYQKFLYDLPFTLTQDQEKVLNNLINKLLTEQKMQTLVLGDVGSGKTIVSIIISLLLINGGYQVAIMAPTEVLAKQLYNNYQMFLEAYDYKIELLTSAKTKREKNKIKDNILVGYTKVLIGTHAIIQEDVVFKNLALAIIDEQHRFGVEQRNKLIDKTLFGEYLYLSATPIPRTLAQSMFGVMDVEFIETKPQNRKKIITEVYNKQSRKKMLQILENQLRLGHQVYIIAPTIEETEIQGLENVQTLYENFTEYYQGKYPIGLLHGAMKSQDKDKIMEKFKNKEYNILIATTVIEVGVDVENATVMMIVNAERYGLAQLHQLRGRVGRSALQSYCLLYDKSNNSLSKERLQMLKEYEDGFTLANKDLKIRGNGNFFGKEQSGFNEFKLFDYYEDYEIAQKVIKELENN